MIDALTRIIELGATAEMHKDSAVARAMDEYDRTCSELGNDLKKLSNIKAGDTIEIIGGYRHKGKKAEVHEIDFMVEDGYMRGYNKNKYASARVSLLKKDGSLSKVSPIIQLKHVRKV